jgi:hypothetical protein
VPDETTSGPVDTRDLARIGHRQGDFAAIGLPIAAPPRVVPLWWNCDYGLYWAVIHAPGYDYYVSIEDDVAVNVPLRHLVDEMAARGLDCVVASAPRGTDGWSHAHSCADLPYARTVWSELSTLMLSRRAAHFLLAERQRLGAMYAAGTIRNWPFCEGFLASALLSGQFRVAALRDLVELPHYNSQLIFLETDPRVLRAGTLAHAVLGKERFARKFAGRSGLELMLRSVRYEDIDMARRALIDLGCVDVHGLRLRAAAGNLALYKPATQSSLHSASRKPAVAHVSRHALDARGANSGVLTGRASFHTDIEDNPWWEVDLLQPGPVQEVWIFNGQACPERARHFSVLLSTDGMAWTRAFRKTDERVFSGFGDPMICRWDAPVAARWVRVMLDATAYLHLDEIEVYGPAGRTEPPAPGAI